MSLTRGGASREHSSCIGNEQNVQIMAEIPMFLIARRNCPRLAFVRVRVSACCWCVQCVRLRCHALVHHYCPVSRPVFRDLLVMPSLTSLPSTFQVVPVGLDSSTLQFSSWCACCCGLLFTVCESTVLASQSTHHVQAKMLLLKNSFMRPAPSVTAWCAHMCWVGCVGCVGCVCVAVCGSCGCVIVWLCGCVVAYVCGCECVWLCVYVVVCVVVCVGCVCGCVCGCVVCGCVCVWLLCGSPDARTV